MKKQTYTMRARVLLLPECGQWTAQCLEYDIAAQGKTRQDAIEALEHQCTVQMALDIKYQRVPPLQLIPPAPSWYWKRFRHEAKSKDRRRCTVSLVAARQRDGLLRWTSMSYSRPWRNQTP